MSKRTKKKLLNEETENLITGFMLLSVGVVCSTIEYYARASLFPNLLNILFTPIGLSNPVKMAYNELYGISEFDISSAWYLFIMLGLIFFIQSITKYKSKYKIKAILLLTYYTIWCKYYTGLLEFRTWKLNL